MSSWYTLAVNASVVIIHFQLQRGQLLKTSLLENCRLSQKQESIRSHRAAVRVVFERKTADFSFTCTDSFCQQRRARQAKPNILRHSPWRQHEQEVLTFSAKELETKWQRKKKGQPSARKPMCTARLLSRLVFLLLSEHKVITGSHREIM